LLPWQRVGRGKIQLAAFDGPFPKTPPQMPKNLADISYASQAIANSIPNFVAMATGVGRGKMRLATFDGPSPKTPYRCKNLADISYTSQVIANFVPSFVAMATGFNGGKYKCHH